MSFFRQKIKGEQVAEPNREVESETLKRWRAAADLLQSEKANRDYTTRDFVLCDEAPSFDSVPAGTISLSEDAALPVAHTHTPNGSAEESSAASNETNSVETAASELPTGEYPAPQNDLALEEANENAIREFVKRKSQTNTDDSWKPDLAAANRDFSERIPLAGEASLGSLRSELLGADLEEPQTVSVKYYEPPKRTASGTVNTLTSAPAAAAATPATAETMATPGQPASVLPSDFQLSFDDDLKRRFGGNIRSALGPGTVIEGTFRFDSPVCVDGTLNGEVNSSSALIVGEQAQISARVKVGAIILLGTVCGDIEADDLVEIRRGGKLVGDIVTRRIVIEDGGIFEGNCTTKS